MAEPITYHLAMTDAAGVRCYHLECTSVTQALSMARAHRGPEALTISDSTRQCYACRPYGTREPVELHLQPHRY
jgi:hypothetical protein